MGHCRKPLYAHRAENQLWMSKSHHDGGRCRKLHVRGEPGALSVDTAARSCTAQAAGRLIAFADETKPLQRHAGQIDAFRGNLQPMDGRGMGQDHLDDADVDAERHGSCAQVCTLAAIPEGFVATLATDLLLAEVAPEGRERRSRGSRRGGFPSADISGMDASTRSPKVCRRATDDQLKREPPIDQGLGSGSAHFRASSRREGHLARVSRPSV